MNTNSLFKLSSLVASALTLCFALAPSASLGQTQPISTANELLDKACLASRAALDNLPADASEATKAAAAAKEARDCAHTGQGTNTCSSEDRELREAIATKNKVSATQMARYSACYDNDGATGRSILDDEGDEDLAYALDEGNNSACGRVNLDSNCSGIVEANYEDALNDAQKNANDAQKSFVEAKQTLAKESKAASRKITAIQQAVRDNERAHKSTISKIQLELEEALKKIEADQRAKALEIKAKLTEQETLLDSLQQQYRQMELAAAESVTKWEADCRDEANRQLVAKKAEQTAEEKEAKAKGEKRNFGGSSLAGATKRKLATKRREQQLAYTNAYKDCVAGLIPPGSSGKKALEDSKARLAEAVITMKEKQKAVAKQIEVLLKELSDFAISVGAAKDSAQKLAMQKVSDATDAYNSSLEKASTGLSEANEDLQDILKYGNEAVMVAGQAATQAQAAAQTAQARAACMPQQVSSAKEQSILDKYNDALAAKTTIESLCSSSSLKCPSLASNKACTTEAKPEDRLKKPSTGSTKAADGTPN